MLTAWCYRTPLGAKAGEVHLRRLQGSEALGCCAVVVTWSPGAHCPRTTHVRHRTHVDLDEPVMLEALARTLLAVSTSGTPEVAAAAAHRLRGTGIDSEFLLGAARYFSPGRSVLLVLSERADPDGVLGVVEPGVAAGGMELLSVVVPPAAVGSLRMLLQSWGE